MKVSLFMVPSPVSTPAVERSAEIALLEKALLAHRSVAIVGPDGQGKSQLAAAYADRHFGRYSMVIRLPGDSPLHFEKGLEEIARLLWKVGLLPPPRVPLGMKSSAAEARKVVRNFLTKAADYLLIWDNLDLTQPRTKSMLWPAHLTGHVLITTANKNVQDLGVATISAPKLSAAATRAILSAGRATDGEEGAALNILCDFLQGQALAVDLASAYLRTRGCSFSEYLQELLAHEEILAALRELKRTPDSAFAIPLLLSLRHIERQSLFSIRALKFLSFLKPDGVPQDLLFGAQSGLVLPIFWEIGAQFPKLPNQVLGSASWDYYLRYLQPLLAHHLLSRDELSGAIYMHRGISRFLRSRMSKKEQTHWVTATLSVVDEQLRNGRFYSEKLPQLLPSLPSLIQAAGELGIAERAASLFRQLLDQLKHDGLDESIPWFEKTCGPAFASARVSPHALAVTLPPPTAVSRQSTKAAGAPMTFPAGKVAPPHREMPLPPAKESEREALAEFLSDEEKARKAKQRYRQLIDLIEERPDAVPVWIASLMTDGL